jgi:N-methylhydantoinase A
VKSTVVHGTTVGTNALLERKGARTGIITTEGFRDVLEMRRRDRPTTWGLKGSFTPVVERPDRVEVGERVLADGSVLRVVDEEDEVKARARALAADGCEAVCVFFINGYANNDNEMRAVEAVRSVWPNAYVTAATEILPEIREFERLSTATLNAYLQPVVSSYLDRLESGLANRNFGGDILIVQSNGGVMSVDTAKRYPSARRLSGPAAGVIAATAIAKAAGFPNIITCDMGGTSFDVSLIADGEAALAAQTAIDFGMVVRTPMIEITTIGAGGGSIAWVDKSGLLQVGPESAGSDPGPVCYGLGNDRPTVTDANLVLGRINPDRPIGGKLDRLDIDAARGGDRDAYRQAARTGRRRCGGSDPEARQRQNGRRDPPRFHRERPRPGEIRGDALRRRRRAAHRRADQGGRPRLRPCAALPRRDLGAWAASLPICATTACRP